MDRHAAREHLVAYGIENVGTGTYTAKRDIDVVSRDGLYASTYELIRRFSRTKNVLDLGCSDGVGTYGLDPSFYALGIDFDAASVDLANQIAHERGARGEGPRYEAVKASLLDLPPELLQRLRATPFDTVVLLDVLEHFEPSDALAILRAGRTLLPEDHVVIVSMPVISAFSIATHRELAQIARDRQRPPDGLFDRTHRILRGKRFHRRLFRQAGYSVIEEYQTDQIIGATGDWDWQAGGSAVTHLAAEVARRTESKHRAARILTQMYAAGQGHRLAQKAVEAAFVYQGLYVLTNIGERVFPEAVQGSRLLKI
ncbi:class I SAM-dependent methyltransferase [Nocardioides sp. GCM10028917]|uniref:class I SAM-dependent methyltransferase n=1 Tax=Nocardioides sp. GCM10028917 TaxID=3273408 RepID=UPI00361EDE32